MNTLQPGQKEMPTLLKDMSFRTMGALGGRRETARELPVTHPRPLKETSIVSMSQKIGVGLQVRGTEMIGKTL